MVDPEDYEAVRRLIDQADFEKMYPQLVGYAHRRLSQLKWKNGIPPGGIEARDLVQKSIEQVYWGERQWNPEKQPDLTKFLMDAIKSISGHLARSKDNTTREIPPEGDGNENWEATIPAQIQDPGERMDLERIKEKFTETIKGDEDAEIVLEYLLDGYKPREIAKDLGMSSQETEAVVRRVYRKLRERFAK